MPRVTIIGPIYLKVSLQNERVEGPQGIQGPSGITGGGQIIIGVDNTLYFRKGLGTWFVIEGSAFSGEPPTGEAF
jgi:hypothetical protein